MRGVPVTLAVLLVAVCGLTPTSLATAEDIAPAAPTVDRVAGADRYATSAAISAVQFPDPAAVDAVYLASGQVLADALVAGTVRDGPVLLVPRCSGVPSAVGAEIARLDPSTVYAVGGTAAVCGATLARAAGTRTRVRLAGPDRAATAAVVAAHVFPAGARTVYLARGADAVDAVAGGTLTGGPILLTSQDGRSLPPATAAAIEATAPTRVVALGGTAAVTDAVLEKAAAGRATGRLSGADRYATSVAIARAQFPQGSTRVFLARGDGAAYVDAVAAGVLTRGPVLLVHGPCAWLPSAVSGYLRSVQPTRVTALGGTGSICTSMLRQAARAASPPVDCARTPCVALTFDDGPSEHTGRLLDVLAERGVPATWFVQGSNVQRRPALTRRIAMEGHQVENHTWDHPQLSLLSGSAQRSQLERTDAAVRAAGAGRTERLRPPYGDYNRTTRTLGVPLVLWSVDSEDWVSRNAATIRSRIRATVHTGAIVLQHDTIGPSVDAVPGVVADLRARGFTLVTVDELVPTMRPGDLVYRRGFVVPAGEDASPGTVFTLDGMPFGPVRIDPDAWEAAGAEDPGP